MLFRIFILFFSSVLYYLYMYVHFIYMKRETFIYNETIHKAHITKFN